MVVDDTATAQRCVELLRRNALGVATFLLLDKQAHLAAKLAERVSPPEGTPSQPHELLDVRRLQRDTG